jgi:hypothetical protein
VEVRRIGVHREARGVSWVVDLLALRRSAPPLGRLGATSGPVFTGRSAALHGPIDGQIRAGDDACSGKPPSALVSAIGAPQRGRWNQPVQTHVGGDLGPVIHQIGHKADHVARPHDRSARSGLPSRYLVAELRVIRRFERAVAEVERALEPRDERVLGPQALTVSVTESLAAIGISIPPKREHSR